MISDRKQKQWTMDNENGGTGTNEEKQYVCWTVADIVWADNNLNFFLTSF